MHHNFLHNKQPEVYTINCGHSFLMGSKIDGLILASWSAIKKNLDGDVQRLWCFDQFAALDEKWRDHQIYPEMNCCVYFSPSCLFKDSFTLQPQIWLLPYPDCIWIVMDVWAKNPPHEIRFLNNGSKPHTEVVSIGFTSDIWFKWGRACTRNRISAGPFGSLQKQRRHITNFF